MFAGEKESLRGTYTRANLQAAREKLGLHEYFKKDDMEDLAYRVQLDHEARQRGERFMVRAYKPFGVKITDPRCFGCEGLVLPDDCLFLVMIDEEMVEHAMHAAPLKLIDATHGVSLYKGTKHISMMSRDKADNGHHEAWFVTNVENKELYEQFFEVVKREMEKEVNYYY